MMGESCVCLGSKEICVFGSFRPFFKRGSLLGNEEMDLGGDLPFFELEYWNFQHMLDLWFREASQNLSSFRQLFFSRFPRGDQRKNAEKLPKLHTGFSTFFVWSPLGSYEKKSSVSSDLNISFKRPRKKKHLLRVSLKMVENWRNGSQMC